MRGDVESSPPQVSEEGAVPAIGVARVNRKATSSLATSGRSIKHPTYYLVGSLNGHEVYWHPVLGYAFEALGPEGQLFALDHQDNKDIDWAEDEAFYPVLRDVIESGLMLLDAMDARLRVYVDALLDDVSFAEQCEREKRAVLIAANAQLVSTEAF